MKTTIADWVAFTLTCDESVSFVEPFFSTRGWGSSGGVTLYMLWGIVIRL